MVVVRAAVILMAIAIPILTRHHHQHRR